MIRLKIKSYKVLALIGKAENNLKWELTNNRQGWTGNQNADAIGFQLATFYA